MYIHLLGIYKLNAFLGFAEVLDMPDFELFFPGSGRCVTYYTLASFICVVGVVVAVAVKSAAFKPK